MDLTPLQSRDFRLLFLAGTVFYLGGMVSYVAIPFQICTLTGSNFAAGAIASDGFACVAGVGLTALALRDFWSYEARTHEHAGAERTARLGADRPRP